jgi:hypothetical protein
MFGFIRRLFERRADSHARPRRRVRLACERLEERALMAADVSDTMGLAPLWNVTGTEFISSTIGSPSDVDLFKIQVKNNLGTGEGEVIAFDIDRPAGSGLDSYLRIFDSKGREIDSNQDGSAPGEKKAGGDSYLARKFTSGTYYVGVSAWTNQNYSARTGGGTIVPDLGSAKGAYSLTIRRHGDDINDQIDEAISLGSLTRSRSATGALEGSKTQPLGLRDVDMYSFTVTAGQRIAFDIDGFPTAYDIERLPDTYLRIFNKQGTQLKANNDGAAPDESPRRDNTHSYLEYTFTTGGTYYVGVSAFPNGSYHAIEGTHDSMGLFEEGDYKLILTPLAEDDNDQTSEARGLPWSPNWWDVLPTDGSLENGGDVAMYKITISQQQGAQMVGLDVGVPAGGTLSPCMRIFDANGKEIKSSASGDGYQWTGKLDGVRYTRKVRMDLVLAPGTYYVGVSVRGNNNYDAVTGKGDVKVAGGGKYQLTTTWLGAYTSTNQPA